MNPTKPSLTQTAFLALIGAALAATPLAGSQLLAEVELDAGTSEVTALAHALATVCPLVSVTAHDGHVVVDLDATAEAAVLLRATSDDPPVVVALLDAGADVYVDAEVVTGVLLTYTLLVGDVSCSQTVVVPEEPETPAQEEPETPPAALEEPPETQPAPSTPSSNSSTLSTEADAQTQSDPVAVQAQTVVDACLSLRVRVDEGDVIVDLVPPSDKSATTLVVSPSERSRAASIVSSSKNNVMLPSSLAMALRPASGHSNGASAWVSVRVSVWVVVSWTQAPSVSPWSRCTNTALGETLMVCAFSGSPGGTWQMSTFSPPPVAAMLAVSARPSAARTSKLRPNCLGFMVSLVSLQWTDGPRDLIPQAVLGTNVATSEAIEQARGAIAPAAQARRTWQLLDLAASAPFA